MLNFPLLSYHIPHTDPLTGLLLWVDISEGGIYTEMSAYEDQVMMYLSDLDLDFDLGQACNIAENNPDWSEYARQLVTP